MDCTYRRKGVLWSVGRVDLFHSRRTNYHYCEYWNRDERNRTGNPSQWILDKAVDGTFYAKTVSPKSSQMNVVNGIWANDNNFVTLETDDDINDINRGSVVRFDNELWNVESVQREEHLKESQFSNHIHYKYYLSLRKG